MTHRRPAGLGLLDDAQRRTRGASDSRGAALSNSLYK